MSKETPQEIIIQSLTKRVTELKAENKELKDALFEIGKDLTKIKLATDSAIVLKAEAAMKNPRQ